MHVSAFAQLLDDTSTNGKAVTISVSGSWVITQAAFKGASDALCIYTYANGVTSVTGSTYSTQNIPNTDPPQKKYPGISNWAVCLKPTEPDERHLWCSPGVCAFVCVCACVCVCVCVRARLCTCAACFHATFDVTLKDVCEPHAPHEGRCLVGFDLPRQLHGVDSCYCLCRMQHCECEPMR